jgi:hypothetical protein
MKMTLHIDEALLKRVMEATGATSKTQAVDLALREMDRRGQLRLLTAKGLGMDAEQIKNIFDEKYDLPATRVASPATPYGRKPRSY